MGKKVSSGGLTSKRVELDKFKEMVLRKLDELTEVPVWFILSLGSDPERLGTGVYHRGIGLNCLKEFRLHAYIKDHRERSEIEFRGSSKDEDEPDEGDPKE